MISNYALGEHFDEFIDRLVKSGRYASASEVMRESLKLLEEREAMNAEKLSSLRRSIEDGFKSGESASLDMEEIKSAARQGRGARAVHGR